MKIQKPTKSLFVEELEKLVGKSQVRTALIERAALSTDASIYTFMPKLVLRPRNTEDVRKILRVCTEKNEAVTFRAAGTSLSGQAVSPHTIIDISHHFKAFDFDPITKIVKTEPGVIVGHLNNFLLKFQRKIGPDPASLGACMIGGVVSNNASGMCCGVKHNTYHTMRNVKFILADGTSFDTSESSSATRFEKNHPDLSQVLLKIKKEIEDSKNLKEKISRKFKIKNTCGYSLNAFIDFQSPLDIFAHLLVGSEGTLGFVSEVSFETIAEKPFKKTGIAYFKNLIDAGKAIADLAALDVDVLEIMDRSSMEAVSSQMLYPFTLEGNCAALLIELQGTSEFDEREKKCRAVMSKFSLQSDFQFSSSITEREKLWQMRKGLFPSVGGARKKGTSVIIEDVCVKPEDLPSAIEDLQALFIRSGFAGTVIFGHAKDGNLHFVICADFSKKEETNKYTNMMNELSRLIVEKYDGSLKAEHGTGRNFAPFVELEWGSEIYEMMWRIKEAADPKNILNPGVLLNRDALVHVKNLKVLPDVDPVVDKCIECGFCEPRCPSRHLTLTPRQRISVARRIIQSSDSSERKTLREQYKYYGNESCATDSMCSTSCPVGIDTGTYIKTLRLHSPVSHFLASFFARNFFLVTGLIRGSLRFMHLFGGTRLFHNLLGFWVNAKFGRQPRLLTTLPQAASQFKNVSEVSPDVVLFTSCLSRTLGNTRSESHLPPLLSATLDVLRACGKKVRIVNASASTCCGQAFSTKGFQKAAEIVAEKTFSELWTASEQGRLPVICETSPCSGQLILHKNSGSLSKAELSKLEIYDFCTYMARHIIPKRTDWPKVTKKVVLHPTCTIKKLGASSDLQKVAETFATEVVTPLNSECCGFAGDKGFFLPQLLRSATQAEAKEVSKINSTSHFSTCRTCELGLSAATGRNYNSLIYLCREALCSNI